MCKQVTLVFNIGFGTGYIRHKTEFLFTVFIFLDKRSILSESQFHHLLKGDNNTSLSGLL